MIVYQIVSPPALLQDCGPKPAWGASSTEKPEELKKYKKNPRGQKNHGWSEINSKLTQISQISRCEGSLVHLIRGLVIPTYAVGFRSA
jgi:hypothetical protein